MWRPHRILLVVPTLFLVLPAVLWELESKTRPLKFSAALRGVPAPQAISAPADETQFAAEITRLQSLDAGPGSQGHKPARRFSRTFARDFRSPDSRRSHEKDANDRV